MNPFRRIPTLAVASFLMCFVGSWAHTSPGLGLGPLVSLSGEAFAQRPVPFPTVRPGPGPFPPIDVRPRFTALTLVPGLPAGVGPTPLLRVGPDRALSWGFSQPLGSVLGLQLVLGVSDSLVFGASSAPEDLFVRLESVPGAPVRTGRLVVWKPGDKPGWQPETVVQSNGRPMAGASFPLVRDVRTDASVGFAALGGPLADAGLAADERAWLLFLVDAASAAGLKEGERALKLLEFKPRAEAFVCDTKCFSGTRAKMSARRVTLPELSSPALVLSGATADPREGGRLYAPGFFSHVRGLATPEGSVQATLAGLRVPASPVEDALPSGHFAPFALSLNASGAFAGRPVVVRVHARDTNGDTLDTRELGTYVLDAETPVQVNVRELMPSEPLVWGIPAAPPYAHVFSLDFGPGAQGIVPVALPQGDVPTDTPFPLGGTFPF